MDVNKNYRKLESSFPRPQKDKGFTTRPLHLKVICFIPRGSDQIMEIYLTMRVSWERVFRRRGKSRCTPMYSQSFVLYQKRNGRLKSSQTFY